MSDVESGGVERTIVELLGSSVGRRWLLKAGFGAGALGAAAWGVPRWAAAGSGPVPRGLVAGVAGTTESRVLQFALGAAAELDDLMVHANGQRVALAPHSPLTRMRLLGEGTLWRKLRRSRLTHYAQVELPADRGLVVTVQGTRNGQRVLVAQMFHAPTAATRALAQAAFELGGSYEAVTGCPQRLAELGLPPILVITEDEVVALDSVVDSLTTAVTMSMLHPNVATTGMMEVPATKSLLSNTASVCTLGSYIAQMHQNGQDYATLTPAVDSTGQPSQIKVGPITTTFSTVALTQTDSTFTATAKSAFVASIHGVRDTGTPLGTVITKPLDELHDTSDTATWHQSEGVVPTSTPYVPPTGVGDTVQVNVTKPYPTLWYGTYTKAGELSGSQLPLTLYNNYVRWVWVYVQYLKADGTNLNLEPSASFPNTKYSRSLGLLPQIFTVLGVPIWDTNTIDVTLNFPTEATSARLMFCGLGNDAIDGGWRQYFPPDAYPDHIAPQDEVLFPALVTGILTIGLTSFALLTDLDIATTWAAVRKIIEDDIPDMAEVIDQVLGVFPALTAAESFAATVAAGAATYEDIAANGTGNVQNIWSLIAGLASIIPKVIFNPAAATTMAEIAIAIASTEAATKFIQAIPIIGQVVAVIEAVGDAATLAEAIGETVSAPWVIANEINLQYAATVTVSRDLADNAATWPVTGRTWRLESTIDGATALAPKTGTLNEGGRIESDPIVVDVTAPFGGKTIKWSFVVLDGSGNQVGTGVTQLANNDQNNVPSAVAFQIKEIPAAITATTVFTRTDTTTFDPGVGGYTWSDAVVDTGTVAASDIQEVTGVTISTGLGVAGIVWKQNDQYWLRGVPVVENATTITLGGATRQGYARRPFLLFDAFVTDADLGNHVLVEPDDIGSGYHIRALSIDPTTGALSWDPTVSLGQFTLPVDAAALHSSGRVVALHTDSGRLAHVMPANTPQPPLAAYSAGPGTEIGLLSSPTAVAVTNPGIVIVLEAGASQLAAFDLAGNPVRYFGTSTPADFTLPLPSATYLDVAVDGANQIYLLSYSGDGSQVADYRIDVYNPTGAPVATNSPGTNIPHLAVDYWRSIYAANYTALLNTTTNQPHIDPTLGVPEPSLSRLDPS